MPWTNEILSVNDYLVLLYGLFTHKQLGSNRSLVHVHRGRFVRTKERQFIIPYTSFATVCRPR